MVVQEAPLKVGLQQNKIKVNGNSFVLLKVQKNDKYSAPMSLSRSNVMVSQDTPKKESHCIFSRKELKTLGASHLSYLIFPRSSRVPKARSEEKSLRSEDRKIN